MSAARRATAEALRRRAEALLARSPEAFKPADVKSTAALAQELAVFQAELELQNEELRETQAALRDARDRFATLYEHAPAGYVVLDASGIVRQTNATWRAMLNRPDDDFRGLPFVEAIVPEDAPIFLGRFRTFFRNPAEKQIVVRLARRGGEPFHARIEAGHRPPALPAEGAPPDSTRLELMVIVTDVSDLHEARRRVEDQHRELQRIHERTSRLNAILRAIRNVNQLITKEDDRARLIAGACVNLTEALSYHNAWIALVDAPGGAVTATADAGFDGGFAMLRARLSRGEFPACLEDALARDQVVVVDDPATGCPDCPVSTEYHGRAGLVRRLAFAGRVFGAVAVSVPAGFARDQEEQTLFDEVAGDLAFALHKIDAAERLRETEAQLRLSEEKFARVFQASPDAIILTTVPDGRIVEVNEGFERITGYTAAAVSGRTTGELELWIDPEARREYASRVLRDGSVGNFEAAFRSASGAWLTCLISGSTVPTSRGRLFVSVVRDITDRKHAEDALRDAERYVRTILETTADGFWVLDDGGRVVEVNDAYCAMSGYARDEILGLAIADLDADERPEETAARIGRVLATGSEIFATHHRRKDGSVFPVEVSTTLLREHGGRFVCFCRDLSERARREERIALLGQMLDEAPAAITIHDEQGRFLFANRETLTLHGYADEAEFRAVNLHELDVPESEAQLTERFRLIAEDGEARFEVAHRRRDGSAFPLEVFAKRIVWDGRPAVLSIATDITERKRAEDQLRRRETLLQRIFEVLPVGLWLTDKDGTLLRGNPAAVRIWGAEPRVPIAEYGLFKAWRLPSREPVLPDEWALARTIREGVTIVDELLEIEAFDGKRRTILNYTAPVLDERGAVEGAIVINLDVSDRVAMEEKLAQAQKMEAVGRLAGGVAHDFNNMLSVILGYTELALDRVDPAELLHADLEEVHGAASRSAEITRQLLAFARRQTISPVVLDLNATVESMLKMLRRLIGEDIDLSWRPRAELWPVNMDPSQIDQILANLCVNARDAISGVGRVTIETANVTVEEIDGMDPAGCVAGDYVQLAVSDDGCGMDGETLRRVFEPFFTTKSVGDGTGLGLATVYGIVKQNRGFVNAYSEPGGGTTFRLYLPRHVGEGVAREAAGTLDLAHGQGETVLIVEDEASILKLATTMLQRLGYVVLGASTPEQAIALAEDHAGGIHLLVSDVVMPEMNGRDLADRLLARHPELKVLFMSGYTANVIAHRGVLDEGVAFIQKPFTIRDFAIKVRKTLEAS